jgi:AbiV family abortive infection protein
MSAGDFRPAILASLQNGDRLSEDAETMLDYDRFPTANALAVLAQEEYAKAFLLALVNTGALPWSNEVRRALRDHICKQLATVILDYLSPDIDEFLQRVDPARIGERQPLPSDVVDSIHLICYERLRREWDRWWVGPSDRPLDDRARSVADRRIDAEKQDAIYVRVGRSGEVVSTPIRITSDTAETGLERAKRIGDQLRPDSGSLGLPYDLDSGKVMDIFRLLTGALSPDDFQQRWA